MGKDAQATVDTASARGSFWAVGARLRSARETRGVSEEAASRAAAIPIRYLRMLEDGDFSTVADPAYLTHFLRRYASWLDLDSEQATRDFLAETEPDSTARRSGRKTTEPSAQKHLRRPLPSDWGVYLVLLLVGIGAVFAAVRMQEEEKRGSEALALRPRQEPRPSQSLPAAGGQAGKTAGEAVSPNASVAPPAVEPQMPPAAAAPATQPPAAPRAEPQRAEVPAPIPDPLPAAGASGRATADSGAAIPAVSPSAAESTAPIQSADPSVTLPSGEGAAPESRDPARPAFELSLTATARQVWIWVSIDGGPRRAVSLKQGETVTWTAAEGYVLSVDDAGGLRANLNGEDLPSLGPAAQARRNLVIPSSELTPPRAEGRNLLPSSGGTSGRAFG